MPSAVSNQSNYYTAHHRRQSSQSQTNLPDQIRNPGPQLQSPNRSLVFLPSTAYTPSQPATQRSRTSSLSNPSRSTSRLESVRNEDIQNDPHDFYRQYQDPFANSSLVALHQEAIRTDPIERAEEPPVTARKSSFTADDRMAKGAKGSSGTRKLSLNTQTLSNGTYDGGHVNPSGPMPHTLKSRKASFKDLVARFDASPDDVPPLPTQQVSRPASRTASPMPYASVETSHSYHPQVKRPTSRVSEASRRAGSALGFRATANDKPTHSRDQSSAGGLTQVASNPEVPAPGRQLLFGEVPSSAANLPAAPGYGIYNARRRRGSEGSPMHSPNPMFSTKRGNAQSSAPPISPSAMHSHTSGYDYDSYPHSRPPHRRANSDFSGPPSKVFVRADQTPSPSAQGSSHKLAAESSSKSTAQSRIPVSTRHQRIASDSAAISPTGRPAIVPHQQLPFRALESGLKPSNPSSSGERRQHSPKRQPRSPVQIKSPNNRGRPSTTANGEKSPSLRANIIAPPPKVSPPLRSSRPRLPVSSATTAASRAKMAEKFQTMAKQQSDRKAFRRQRPPELSDIDLKARRLKITQALSRSREGQDLKGDNTESRDDSASREGSRTPSFEDSDGSDQRQETPEIPAVVVNEAPIDASEERAFYTDNGEGPEDQRALTQTALKIVEGNIQHPGDEMDSPTLGHAESGFNSIPFSLNTHLQPTRDEQEPQSAVTEGTVATEATMIDAEPQTDTSRLQTPGLSLRNQINVLRSQDSTSPLSSASQASGENSDHADQVSVHLMLRDTTYLDDDEAVEKGYRHLVSLPQLEPAHPHSDGRNSWTSSIEDLPESETGNEPASVVQPLPQLQHETEITHVESDSHSASDHSSVGDGSNGEHHASDAYTIVNKVLQQQTPSGVVDQQLVDDIYHRIIQASPDLADVENVDEEKVQRLCLEELEEYTRQWDHLESSRPQSTESFHTEAKPYSGHDTSKEQYDNTPESPDIHSSRQVTPPPPPLPPSSYRTHHRYKSSLDNAGSRISTTETYQGVKQKELDQQPDDFLPVGAEISIPRPPSHSPPPPPIAKMPTIDQTSWSAPTGIRPPIPQTAPPARPLTALSQMSARSSIDTQTIPSSSHNARPSLDDQSPEQRRLKQRRHVLKELVDTEYTYERDMRVLCDIYKQTATAAINDEDIKIIFGNVDLVQQFSKDFLAYLKQVVRPAYIMERSDRRKDGNRTSTVQSSAASIDGVGELTDLERDELTRVGTAFEASMGDMEKVYTDYIRTRHAANKRLEVLQSSAAVREWLKECSENSSDITNAWSLDALLVKPIQRITKYPLLLNQLLEATPNTHPDVEFIRKAAVEVTEVNVRINEVKKHTELVDQVLNRKRKESDVRNGLTKAFGRRAEKLRQHVGINEIHEDPEYTKLKISYDNNIAHLFLVTKDCQAISKRSPSGLIAYSKLRQFAIVVRGVNSIALPDHNEQVIKRVVQPMEKTATMLERFRSDSKGLIQKRDKRLLDYNQFKNKKDRGEKIDKKMTERMEQWEALNLEAKERMKRLLRSTADLVHTCQANLIQLHLNWLAMCRQKFSAAMEIPLNKLEKADIVKDWQEDFDFQEATALSLSICNGSLLAEAVNMVSAPKRSVSTSDDMPPLPLKDHYHRNSGGPMSSQSDDHTEWSSSTFANGRIRTGSAASGRIPKTPETGSRGVSASLHTINSTNVSRPGTSPGLSADSTQPAPRLSFEAPSPSLGELLTESPMAVRHASSSTFYSANPGPSQSHPQLPTTSGASVFSSAMPMEENPETETASMNPEPRREPGVLFTAASVYEFNIDRSRQQGGFRYLTYVIGEIFDIIAEHGELWLAINQDDPTREIGWIWNKHFAKLAE
ncbi:RhoGEF domain-containing protein [Cladophialophora immunda]|nr:RhoGEF domain-containing protein [Cladophialophora immunda]